MTSLGRKDTHARGMICRVLAISLATALAACNGNVSSKPTDSGVDADDATPGSLDGGDGGLRALAVGAGAYSSCASLSDGTVRCWGLVWNADAGGVGDPSPEIVQGVTNATALAMDPNGDSACAVLAGGSVTCWTTSPLIPAQVAGLSDVVQVATNDDLACARLSGGTIECWGDDNSLGQLGNGTTNDEPGPVAVSSIANAIGVSVRAYSACALLLGGAVQCWGEYLYPSASPSATPVTIPGLSAGTAISTGNDITCILVTGGTIECFGEDPITGDFPSGPVTLPGISNAIAISAGTGELCAIVAGGNVACWVFGNTDGGVPEPVPNLSDAVAIAVGVAHGCALRSNGAVVCWGSNAEGQLGDGTSNPSPTPVTVQW